jgi:hypothetical protein
MEYFVFLKMPIITVVTLFSLYAKAQINPKLESLKADRVKLEAENIQLVAQRTELESKLKEQNDFVYSS